MRTSHARNQGAAVPDGRCQNCGAYLVDDSADPDDQADGYPDDDGSGLLCGGCDDGDEDAHLNDDRDQDNSMEFSDTPEGHRGLERLARFNYESEGLGDY